MLGRRGRARPQVRLFAEALPLSDDFACRQNDRALEISAYCAAFAPISIWDFGPLIGRRCILAREGMGCSATIAQKDAMQKVRQSMQNAR